ncbi:MAG: UbiD family decarboxylase [Desulfobacterales bacterium]|nr:MAG: UbiD family decarboxylase [Desulfobacterales bacterium]
MAKGIARDMRKGKHTSSRRRTTLCGDLARRGMSDLNGVIDFLSKRRQLVRVKTTVDPRYELGAVAFKFHGGKPVLFESVKGSPWAVFAGLYWNRAVLADLFGLPETRLPFHFAEAVAEWRSAPVHPVIVDSAPCQEVVEKQWDLRKLPAPLVGTREGGPYLTAAVIIARDPDTGVRNASIMRCMITGRDRMTCLMDIGRHLRDYYERAEARGQPLEITINNGVDPAVHIASVVPAVAAPIELDELGIASHLLGEPLALVKAKTVAVEAVATAQFVLEAELLPKLREPEGPAAEVTGYYAQKDNRWVIRVKGVTRRKNPIWHTIIPGREVHNAVGLMAEASIFRSVSSQVPVVKDVVLTYGGCGFYHAVVQIEKNIEGMERNAILATFAAFPSLKQVVVVDSDVDIRDPQDVEWALATRFRPDRDILLIPHARGHELNPVTDAGLGCKIGLDATAPYPRPQQFERFKVREVDINDYEIEPS